VYYPLAMLGNRTSEQWIAQYASSHRHPVNRACHTLGIPTILIAILVFVGAIFKHRLWPYALGLFILGWIFQFIGHAFEGKPPEFFQDWRFLGDLKDPTGRARSIGMGFTTFLASPRSREAWAWLLEFSPSSLLSV
jgi:hypothetical protein